MMANFPSHCPLTAHWMPTEIGRKRQKIRLFASNLSGNIPIEFAHCPLKKRISEQRFRFSGQWEGSPYSYGVTLTLPLQGAAISSAITNPQRKDNLHER